MEKRDLGGARGNQVLRPLMANLYLDGRYPIWPGIHVKEDADADSQV